MARRKNLSKGRIRFRMSGAGDKEIDVITKGLVKDLNPEIEKNLQDAYKKAFETNQSVFDWGKGGSLKKGMQVDPSMVGSQFARSQGKYAKELRKAFADAWIKKYKIITTLYKYRDPNPSPYKDRPWYKKRKKYQGSAMSSYSSKPVKFVSHGLTTGLLRSSIQKGFERGGTGFVDVGNLLLVGGYKIDLDMIDEERGGRGEYSEFVKYMTNINVAQDIEDFFDFYDSDWNNIAKIVKRGIRATFVKDLEKGFSELRSLKKLESKSKAALK